MCLEDMEERCLISLRSTLDAWKPAGSMRDGTFQGCQRTEVRTTIGKKGPSVRNEKDSNLLSQNAKV